MTTTSRAFTPGQQAYLYAMADAVHEEYRAITDAGLLLQIDLAAMSPGRRKLVTDGPDPTPSEVTRAIEQGVEIVNHALRGIPEEQVRYYHCWGSMNQPHTQDAPPRELVAWRIKNFASVVGQENLIAGVDCGFSHYWDSIRVRPTVQWAKLTAAAAAAGSPT